MIFQQLFIIFKPSCSFRFHLKAFNESFFFLPTFYSWVVGIWLVMKCTSDDLLDRLKKRGTRYYNRRPVDTTRSGSLIVYII
jgi:hypothetical protein